MRGFRRMNEVGRRRGGAQRRREFAGDVAGLADAGGQYFAGTREQDSDRFLEIVVDPDRTNRLCLGFDHGAHPVFDFHVVGRRIESGGMVSEASATLKLRGASR